jgi:hypothetical protein
MAGRALSPREVFLVAPYEDKWAVREHFGLVTKVFMTRQDAEQHARERAMVLRPSELVMIGADGRELSRAVFNKYQRF